MARTNVAFELLDSQAQIAARVCTTQKLVEHLGARFATSKRVLSTNRRSQEQSFRFLS